MRFAAGTVYAFLVIVFVCQVTCLKKIDLSEGWKIYNSSHTLEGRFCPPIGVYSAYNVDDPEMVLRSKNDVNLRWIARDDWNFELQFQVQSYIGRTKFAFLTFDGIDTVAKIYLNGKKVGQTGNMFVRYKFDVTEVLAKKNNLTVQITSPIAEAQRIANRCSKTPPECPPNSYKGECHVNFLRKMQSSFSSNWTLAAPSMGIWKPVTLEMYDVSVIRDVSVRTYRNGSGWMLKGRVYLETSLKQDFRGQLTVHLIDLVDFPYVDNFSVSYGNPVVDFQILFKEDKIEEWWPNGYGDQKLYYAFVVWKSFYMDENDEALSTQSQKAIQIGFREVELVNEAEGNGQTFYLRVNNRPVFVKGTSWIPSHILPEKMDRLEEVRHLLQAAKDANINLIRMWSGGVYESDEFYNLADNYGIMIWHDLMFNSAMYPVTRNFLKSVHEEVKQNVQRISYHPSVVLWVANNQIELALAQNWFGTSKERERYQRDYKKLFVDTVLDDLMKHGNQIYLLSTPSNGNINNSLAEEPQSKDFGDFHYFPENTDPFDPASYEQARFVSQFGFESLPCLTAWKRIMDPNDIVDDLVEHRSHNFDLRRYEQIIGTWLPLPEKSSYDYWKGFMYMSQLAQAIVVKTQTEAYRRQRKGNRGTMGAVYSQLNDVWIAPTQSSIDFYGNYKILQNWAKYFLAPIAITAHYNSYTGEVEVHIVQDGSYFEEETSFTIIMDTYSWSRLLPKTSTRIFTSSSILLLQEPSSSKLIAQMPLPDILEDGDSKNDCFFQFLLLKDGEVLSSTFFFPDAPKHAVGIGDPNIVIRMGSGYSCDSGTVTVNFVVTVNKPAIFVFFEVIRLSVSQVRFSENGFIQTERAKTITLNYYDPSCTVVKERNIGILSLNQFMKS